MSRLLSKEAELARLNVEPIQMKPPVEEQGKAMNPQDGELEQEASAHIALLQRTDADLHRLSGQLSQVEKRLEKINHKGGTAASQAARGGMMRFFSFIGVFFLGAVFGPKLLSDWLPQMESRISQALAPKAEMPPTTAAHSRELDVNRWVRQMETEMREPAPVESAESVQAPAPGVVSSEQVEQTQQQESASNNSVSSPEIVSAPDQTAAANESAANTEALIAGAQAEAQKELATAARAVPAPAPEERKTTVSSAAPAAVPPVSEPRNSTPSMLPSSGSLGTLEDLQVPYGVPSFEGQTEAWPAKTNTQRGTQGTIESNNGQFKI